MYFSTTNIELITSIPATSATIFAAVNFFDFWYGEFDYNFNLKKIHTW